MQSCEGLTSRMRVTVCELNDDPGKFALDWARLVSHAREQRSDFVLLPEMPFCSWFSYSPKFDPVVWEQSVATHEEWEKRIPILSSDIVAGSRPVDREGRRLNEGFLWTRENGLKGIHTKSYLPNENGTWEATWYHAGERDFKSVTIGGVSLGLLICSELWAMTHAQRYGSAGVQILLVPRATEKATSDKWLAGGRTAAVLSGAFCLSSNRTGRRGETEFGGLGWIVSPDGAVLGMTTPKEPFITISIHSDEADRAKKTFPRYMF
jgi:N-carbamoylputrescine amidase